MLRRLYDWVMGLAASRHAPLALFAVSFTESSFFPIPPDVMLAPMVVARRERAYVYAGLCTLASVLGGLLGYAIGYYLTPVGLWLLSILGHADGEAAFRAWYSQWGLWVILIKGLTPIPYKLVTITSGLAHFSLPVFIAASVVTRGARFTLTAFLLKRYGEAVREQVEKRLTLYTIIGVAVLIAIILAIRFF
ncbi:MAG: YqaA family protein [Caulobacteraceae bacterium]